MQRPTSYTRRYQLILAPLLLALAFFCGCSRNQPTEVKIGAILPLTGNMAVFGESFKNGIELALLDLHKKLGKTTLKVIYEDDQGNANQAVAAFRKLVSADRVQCVIGGVMSSTAAPIAPIAQEKQVVLLSPTATAPDLSRYKDFFFRIQPSDAFEGKIMAEFAAQQLHVKSVAVLYVNNDWGLGLAQVFKEDFRQLGGSVPISESYNLGDTDFRTQLTKLKVKAPQFIYLLGYLKELSIILKQMRELGVKSRILSAYSFYDPKLLDIAGDLAENAIFTLPTYDPDSPEPAVSTFAGKYKDKYGKKPDQFAAHAYDCMMILGKAIESGATTGSETNGYIHKLKNYPGVTGTITFSVDNGDVIKPLRMFTVKNREYVPYK